MTILQRISSVLILFLSLAANGKSIETEWLASSNARIMGQVFSAPEAQQLVIMIPSRQGFEQGYEGLAEQLVAQGVEVWQPDWFGSYLQIPSETNLNSVPLADVVDLLAQASKQEKTVHLMAFGRGAPLALNAWRTWQQQQPNITRRGGLVLISPNLVSRTPDPGETAEYLAVVHAIDAPISIFQPQHSPYHTSVTTLSNILAEGGASVWLKTLVNMRDRFFYRPDANATEQAYAPHFARDVAQTLILMRHDKQARTWQPLPNSGAKHKSSANTGKLLVVKGDAPPIQLVDVQGRPATA